MPYLQMMLSSIDYQKYRVLFHVGFWVAYILFFTIAWADEDGLWNSLFYELVHLPVRAGQVYFGLYYLMPRFLLKRKYGQFVGYLLVSFLIVGFLQNFMTYYVYHQTVHGSFAYKEFWDTGNILRAMVRSNSVFVFAAGLKILQHWYQMEKEATQLQHEKTNAELRFLKSQIQPHFFFNTLNTLYGLTLNNSKKAPELVLKLAELMRYMLYKTTADEVSLQEEVTYLENYIELEKMRFGQRFHIQFSKKGNINGAMLPPMLLLPFVENAFKHSLDEEENSAFIALDMEVREANLTFKIENSIAPSVNKLEKGGGIGLENVKKRLALLFPNAHHLKILEENGMYLVRLQIPLTQNIKT